jgi:hypothetical protein
MQITIVTGVEKLGNGIISDMGRRADTVVTRVSETEGGQRRAETAGLS